MWLKHLIPVAAVLARREELQTPFTHGLRLGVVSADGLVAIPVVERVPDLPKLGKPSVIHKGIQAGGDGSNESEMTTTSTIEPLTGMHRAPALEIRAPSFWKQANHLQRDRLIKNIDYEGKVYTDSVNAREVMTVSDGEHVNPRHSGEPSIFESGITFHSGDVSGSTRRQLMEEQPIWGFMPYLKEFFPSLGGESIPGDESTEEDDGTATEQIETTPEVPPTTEPFTPDTGITFAYAADLPDLRPLRPGTINGLNRAISGRWQDYWTENRDMQVLKSVRSAWKEDAYNREVEYAKSNFGKALAIRSDGNKLFRDSTTSTSTRPQERRVLAAESSGNANKGNYSIEGTTEQGRSDYGSNPDPEGKVSVSDTKPVDNKRVGNCENSMVKVYGRSQQAPEDGQAAESQQAPEDGQAAESQEEGTIAAAVAQSAKLAGSDNDVLSSDSSPYPSTTVLAPAKRVRMYETSGLYISLPDPSLIYAPTMTPPVRKETEFRTMREMFKPRQYVVTRLYNTEVVNTQAQPQQVNEPVLALKAQPYHGLEGSDRNYAFRDASLHPPQVPVYNKGWKPKRVYDSYY